jgi:predicted nucleic acid-binding protein
MTIIDTSAWIEFFRKKGDPVVKQSIANLITANEAAYTCPVLFELVYGAFDRELADVKQGLSFATRIDLTRSDWDLAAESARILRKAGITVPQDDLLIATVAMARNLPIFCRDQHFSTIRDAVYPRLDVENV